MQTSPKELSLKTWPMFLKNKHASMKWKQPNSFIVIHFKKFYWIICRHHNRDAVHFCRHFRFLLKQTTYVVRWFSKIYCKIYDLITTYCYQYLHSIFLWTSKIVTMEIKVRREQKIANVCDRSYCVSFPSTRNQWNALGLDVGWLQFTTM